MPSGARHTVLLIEADTSLRRLISLGLQHRGLQVIAVSSFSALTEQSLREIDLLVLDIDNGWRADTHLLTTIEEHAYLADLPRVVLAWDQQRVGSQNTNVLLEEYLPKPFDARRLHATIENLLETSRAIVTPTRADLIPGAGAALISAASLCPLLTAAGLLLTMIGLMLQLVIAGIGLLVVLIGLLWWTLGKRPIVEHELGGSHPLYMHG